MNGKTVEVDNTDAEGRLVLSGLLLSTLLSLQKSNTYTDAIYYTSTEYKPHSLIDVATLTGFVHCASPNIHYHVSKNVIVPWTLPLVNPSQVSSV